MRWMAAVLLCFLLAPRAGVAFGQALDTAVLGQAEALVRGGEPEKAWALLAPLERRNAGQPDFDYLLGLSALESGRANRATFVFERLLAGNPGHLAGRLELARAYFALRDFERAEREFNSILASDPAQDVRALSQAYLDKITGGTARAPGRLTGYAEAALGRDTNVAAATAAGSIFVPGLGEFALDPDFQRRPDDFVALGAGLEYAHALRGDLGVVAGADLRHRWHADAELFDSRLAELHALLNLRLDDRNALQYSLRYSEYQLDDRPYRDVYSFGTQWSRRLTERTRIAVSGQANSIRYRSQAARASSSDLLVASASATHVLQPATLTIVSGALYAGRDDAVRGRSDGDRRLLGASLALQRRLFTRIEGYVRLSMLESDYRSVNPDFDVARKDRQFDAGVGIGWQFADGWLLRPQVVRTSNRSNLTLHEYSRTETSISVQRTWD
jgi:thioredoxin-like negative regulator of GroEL